MAKKKKNKPQPLQISITIELPEDDPEPSAADVFIYKFLETLSWWVLGFFAIALIGLIGAIF
jgi:hypothetical protein